MACVSQRASLVDQEYSTEIYQPGTSRLVANEGSALFPVNPDGSRAVDRSWDQGETWRQMEAVLAKGKVRAIGVSNWSIPYLEKLSESWKVVPAVNQVSW